MSKIDVLQWRIVQFRNASAWTSRISNDRGHEHELRPLGLCCLPCECAARPLYRWFIWWSVLQASFVGGMQEGRWRLWYAYYLSKPKAKADGISVCHAGLLCAIMCLSFKDVFTDVDNTNSVNVLMHHIIRTLYSKLLLDCRSEWKMSTKEMHLAELIPKPFHETARISDKSEKSASLNLEPPWDSRKQTFQMESVSVHQFTTNLVAYDGSDHGCGQQNEFPRKDTDE